MTHLAAPLPVPTLPASLATHVCTVAARAPALAAAECGEVWLSLPLRHLGVRTVRIGYECLGTNGVPVLVVLGGISANRHLAANRRNSAPGWWQSQVGDGKALDPQRYRLLSIDWLGADGRIDGAIDTADQADALAAVLDALDIRQVEAVVGASYGAMVGLAFAAGHGRRLRQLIAISGGDRPHPYASAWRSIQRNLVRLADGDSQRRQALSLARQLALLSYRSPEEFGQRFDQPPVAIDDRYQVAAEAYLHARGEAFARDFDPQAFLRLSESIDLHRVDPNRIQVPVTVVGIEQDQLVPISDLNALAGQLPALRRLVTLSSRYGHDAFLKEEREIAGVLASALAETQCEVAA